MLKTIIEWGNIIQEQQIKGRDDSNDYSVLGFFNYIFYNYNISQKNKN